MTQVVPLFSGVSRVHREASAPPWRRPEETRAPPHLHMFAIVTAVKECHVETPACSSNGNLSPRGSLPAYHNPRTQGPSKLTSQSADSNTRGGAGRKWRRGELIYGGVRAEWQDLPPRSVISFDFAQVFISVIDSNLGRLLGTGRTPGAKL